MKIAGFRTSRQSGDYLRCFNWLEEFRRLGHDVRYSEHVNPDMVPLTHFDEELEELAAWCDVFMATCEVILPTIGRKIVALHAKHGFTLVCDNDDPLEWIKNEEGERDESEALLRDADLVTFVSDRMAADYSNMAKNWNVVESCQPSSAKKIPAIRGVVDSERTNLIFMGWQYHAPDLSMIREDLEYLMASGKYRLISIGVLDGWMSRHTKDELIHVPRVTDWRKLIGFMKGIPNSIAIVPIKQRHETRYNNNVKFLDYAICKIPMVTSDIENNSFLEHGREAWKVNGSWADNIIRVASDDVLRSRLKSGMSRRFMNNYTVEGNAPGYLSLIEAAVGRKETREISG